MKIFLIISLLLIYSLAYGEEPCGSSFNLGKIEMSHSTPNQAWLIDRSYAPVAIVNLLDSLKWNSGGLYLAKVTEDSSLVLICGWIQKDTTRQQQIIVLSKESYKKLWRSIIKTKEDRTWTNIQNQATALCKKE